jgi:hypothetical protein
MASSTMVPTYTLALSADEAAFLMTLLNTVEFEGDEIADAENDMISDIAGALGRHHLQSVTFPSKLTVIDVD